MSTIIHATGWSPERADQARELLATSHSHLYRSGPLFADDGRPLPESFSLSGHRLGKLLQYGWGTCWAHAPKRAKELMDAAGGYEAAPVSRMMIAYQGERLMAKFNGGRIGNPDSGGSVMQAFLAMATADEGGIGACHESKWPYCPDDLCQRSQYAGWDGEQARAEGRRYLAQGPPAGAIADGDASRVHQVAELALSGDGSAWKRAIFNGHPIGIGHIWSDYYDTQGVTFFDRYAGDPREGHALTIIGWMIYQGRLYWQRDNWHGELYKPLPAELAASVPGYKPTSPDKTTDHWIGDAALRQALARAGAEQAVAASSTGFARKVVPAPIWKPGDFA